MNFNLPQEYIDFVNANKKINFSELGKYYESALLESKLIPIDELKLKTINYKEWMYNEAFGKSFDDAEKMYKIEYVDLISYNNAFVWYSQLKCFGQFDSEHGYFFACKDISWEQIEKSTQTYLVGMWEWDEGWDFILDPVEAKVFESFKG